MEPSEFDKIIKQKVDGASNIYTQEIERSKPFVWSEIKANTTTKTFQISWYYVAAAALLFFLCTSVLFLQMQENHRSKIQLLSEQLHQIKSPSTSSETTAFQNQQLKDLCTTIDSLENSNRLLLKKPVVNPPAQNKQIVYLTDTVFVTKVEYITEYIPAQQLNNDSIELTQQIASKIEPEKSSDLIYPDFTSSSAKKAAEGAPVKLKLNTLTIH